MLFKPRNFKQIKDDSRKQVQDQLSQLTDESKQYIADNYKLVIVSTPSTVGKSSVMKMLLRKKIDD